MVNNEELISVIVPIYKVEQYLRKCIDSILNQTYKKLEIILVDDGSPDSCGKICDEYANIDERIKVIHKKNGGLSDARNVGIDMANGEYIVFIDSDDYIEMDYIEYLFNLLKNNNCKMSICSHYVETIENKRIDYGKKYSTTVMNTEECMRRMLCDEGFSVSAWAKMYKKELFANVKYPINKLCEDNGTTYKLIRQCEKIAYGNLSKYIYVKRENSIMTGKFNLKKMDLVELTDNMANELEMDFSSIINAIHRRMIYARLSVLRQAVNDENVDKKIINTLRKDILKNWKEFIRNPEIKNLDRIAFISLIFGNNFYRNAWNLYYKFKY